MGNYARVHATVNIQLIHGFHLLSPLFYHGVVERGKRRKGAD